MFFKWKNNRKKENKEIANVEENENALDEIKEKNSSNKIDKVSDELIAMALKDLLKKDNE